LSIIGEVNRSPHSTLKKKGIPGEGTVGGSPARGRNGGGKNGGEYSFEETLPVVNGVMKTSGGGGGGGAKKKGARPEKHRKT